MNEQGKQSLLDLSILPWNESMLSLGNSLLVMDNLEGPHLLMRDDEMDDLIKRFPMKLTATCLIIVIEGTVSFKVNFRDFTASENNCVIVSAGTIIQSVELNEQARVILLSFNQQNLPIARQRNTHRLYTLQVLIISLIPKHVEMFKTCYSMLRTILTDPSFATNRDDLAYSCMDMMGNILVQNAENQSELTSKTSRRDEIVASFLECVNENYREHRELSFYADQLHLSLKYMSHVVYEQTGRHPSAWIRDHVILDAKAMLRSGRYTVQQVAAELNFPNQSFFGKYFKEAVGISPKKWK